MIETRGVMDEPANAKGDGYLGENVRAGNLRCGMRKGMRSTRRSGKHACGDPPGGNKGIRTQGDI